MSGPIVFLGPTLPASEALAILPEARLAPPIRAGDLLALQRLPGPPPVIAIIDGAFDRAASVWHKEILLALARGSAVWGAASMGALRAAELHAHGMIGVGRIFERYRDGHPRDDADVAVMHLPGERGAAAVTVPLVDVEATLDAAVARGAIDRDARAELLERARARGYRERHDVGPAALGEPVRRKRLDAIELLERLAREPRGASTPRPELHVPTIFVRRLAAWAACRPIGFGAAWLPEAEQLARLARLLGPRYRLIRLLALARAICDALALAPAAAAPAAERQITRLFGMHGAADSPQLASARRIIAQLARAWHALERHLAATGVRIAPDEDTLRAYAAARSFTSPGFRAAMALADAAEHAGFVRFSFAFEHALDPRALGIWGGISIDLTRPHLASAIAELGLADELAARCARWPVFAGELHRWWAALPPELREPHARACDLDGWAEIERITTADAPGGAGAGALTP